MNQRNYSMDWLRVITMLAVFIFHCTLFFSAGDWHIKNNQLLPILDIVPIGFMWMWMMPLLFFVSGFASWYALQKRNNKEFIIERSKRLLIPLYGIGLLLILPPQFYFELITNNNFTGTFISAVQLYFLNLGIGLARGPYIIFTTFLGHLWFLPFLFTMSLITIPFTRSIRSEKRKKATKSLLAFLFSYKGLLMLLAPFIAVKIGAVAFFHSNDSWSDFLYYLLYFILGIAIAANPDVIGSIRKKTWVYFSMGLFGFTGVGLFIGLLHYQYPGIESFSNPLYYPFQIILSITQFGFVFFFIAFASSYLKTNNRFLKYSNDAVLPFYIIHQTLIMIVGWFIKDWAIMIPLKFIFLFTVSFGFSLLVYDLVIKRLTLFRFLFGMR